MPHLNWLVIIVLLPLRLAIKMDCKVKSPDRIRAFRNRLQSRLLCGRVTSSKRIGAMTNQLYTISIKSRKQIALVSFQSHFQERCKQDYVTGRELLSCNTGSRRTLQNRLDVGLMNTPEFIRASWDSIKILLIQIGTRLESYRIKASVYRVTSALVITVD